MKQRFILMILFIAFFTVSTVEAQNKALNNACVYYASLAGSTLKGRIVADILSIRFQSWENAAKESQAAQQYGTKISEWIKEGFEIEK